ncbi:hypothetical protein MRS44_013974 [Fusarium solani]|uniref:uncharacterized protein n=1 Tax=Fusarium solani TaxID=169388 RepID=UPI0032C43255|nr:hypothetical protein MRS44_013974 [Fusarium solani]
MAHEQPPYLFPSDGSEPDDEDDTDLTFGDDDKSTTTLDPEELHPTYIYDREYTSTYEGACSCTPTDDKYQQVLECYGGAWLEPSPSAPEGEYSGIITPAIGNLCAGVGPAGTRYRHWNSELDDCNRDWAWSPRSFDYVRICNMTGNVKDWPRLFRMAGQSTRIGGFMESSEDSIWFGSTIPGSSLPRALQVWNLSIVLAGIRSGRSFHIVEYDQQMQSMVEAGIEVIRTDHSWISYSERLLHNLLDDLDGVFNFPAKQLGWSPERVTVFLSDVRKAIISHGRWLGFRRTVVIGKVSQPP